MDVYIVRHGPAEERGPEWPDDDLRPLSADGKARTRDAGKGLQALGVAPDAILTSPLVRARQTAEVIAQELGRRERLRETRHLAPGAGAAALFQAVREHAPGAAAVMLVGHEPDVGELASRLLAGEGGSIDVPFKKPGVILIEVDGMPPQRRGTLRWFLQPGQLRAIGKAGA